MKSIFDGKFLRTNGNEEWYKNGLLHRLNGPAIMRLDRSKCCFENGRFLLGVLLMGEYLELAHERRIAE